MNENINKNTKNNTNSMAGQSFLYVSSTAYHIKKSGSTLIKKKGFVRILTLYIDLTWPFF